MFQHHVLMEEVPLHLCAPSVILADQWESCGTLATDGQDGRIKLVVGQVERWILPDDLQDLLDDLRYLFELRDKQKHRLPGGGE